MSDIEPCRARDFAQYREAGIKCHRCGMRPATIVDAHTIGPCRACLALYFNHEDERIFYGDRKPGDQEPRGLLGGGE